MQNWQRMKFLPSAYNLANGTIVQLQRHIRIAQKWINGTQSFSWLQVEKGPVKNAVILKAFAVKKFFKKLPKVS